MRFDAIVIGAGPAGSSAANEIAQAGWRVALLERGAHPGKLSVCGGGIEGADFEALGLPGNLIHKRIVRREHHFPWGTATITTPHVTVLRRELDRWLANRAVGAGAELLVRTRAHAVELRTTGSVSVTVAEGAADETTLRTRLVVFADGANTLARRSGNLGFLRTPTTAAVGLVYELAWPGTPLSHYQVYFGADYGRWGYAWVFPKRDLVNVGIAVLPFTRARHCLDRRLWAFVESKPELRDLPVVRRAGGYIPVTPAKRIYDDSMLATGDAAGMVEALTDAGIAGGIMGGRLAGQVACEALAAGDFSEAFLARYQERWERTPRYSMIRSQSQLTRLLLPLSWFDGNLYAKLVQVLFLSDHVSRLQKLQVFAYPVLRPQLARSPNPGVADVLSFDQVAQDDGLRAGGKGHTLARLHQAGFPVPPGFVVVASAYQRFVAANGLEGLIEDALVSDDPAPKLARIRAAFLERAMPPDIAAAIHSAYIALGQGEVAVRSSALAEDGKAASFAGQYETILGVDGCDDLLAAVRRCWSSLWSERALVYRRHTGLDGKVPLMAVVVQNMVQATRAGVALTLDPISGRRDVTIVEAVSGMGDRLVGGQAEPHRYVVKLNGPTERGDALLDARMLATVVDLARRVERWAGEPQDVEWALDGAGWIFLLQARPTAAARDETTDEQATRWTRDNVGEVLPDPVTPLSWSVLEPLGNESFTHFLRRVGVRSPSVLHLFGRFHGRVYLNRTLFQSVMSRFYPSRVGWRAAPRLALTALRSLWLLHRLPAEGKSTATRILQQHRSERDQNLGTLAPGELLALLDGWRKLGAEAMETHLAVTTMAVLLYQVLEKLLARWSVRDVTASVLSVGLTGMRSAEAGQDLIALAQQVNDDDELRDMVLATSPRDLHERLAETEAGRALWAQVESFLLVHGHCAAQEFELAAPRWRDDAATVLGALQAQVSVVGQDQRTDPMTVRQAAIARVDAQLGRVRRQFLRHLLARVQILTVARENLKYHFVLAHGRLRDLYLALADHIAGTGYLREAEEIFLLKHEEVTACVAGQLTPEQAQACVMERHQGFETDRSTAAPRNLDQMSDGDLQPVPQVISAHEAGSGRLNGLPGSPGSYVGRARVVLTPDDGTGMKPGEVLVVPATSPGWAPILLAAGALVTEIGGVLSHGAIIAREYGLPAVLNVAGATHHIHTGQLVQVDGSQGIVRILEQRA